MKKVFWFIGVLLFFILAFLVYDFATHLYSASLADGEIIPKDISPYVFQGNLSQSMDDFGSSVIGQNARYLYTQVSLSGSIRGSSSSATVYSFEDENTVKAFFDKTKALWDSKDLAYSVSTLNKKIVYVFTRGDRSDFMWVHEKYLIQVSVDREVGNMSLDEGLEVRDAYLKKYS